MHPPFVTFRRVKTSYYGVAYSKAFIAGKWQYARHVLSLEIIPLRCGTRDNLFTMESDEVFLTPEQKLQEQEVITKCFNLMRNERSRYEKQAEVFLEFEFLNSESEDFDLVFSIQDDLYTCKGVPKSTSDNRFTSQKPIPTTKTEKIETLIELFAQSEAGLIQ